MSRTAVWPYSMPLGVTGNTPDSGSGESWFDPRRGNCKGRSCKKRAHHEPPRLSLLDRCSLGSPRVPSGEEDVAPVRTPHRSGRLADLRSDDPRPGADAIWHDMHLGPRCPRPRATLQED